MGERADLSGQMFSNFLLVERIAQDEFGELYRSETLMTQGVRPALVRVLRQGEWPDGLMILQSQRRAQFAATVGHPYIACFYGFGHDPDHACFWIMTAHGSGTPLDRWLRERGPMPLEQLVPFFAHLAEAVDSLHACGVLADLWPARIQVLDWRGRHYPYLVDWVLCWRDVGPSVTPDDAPVDVLPYLAPEWWDSVRTVGPRANVYALGVLAYEALTGRTPFHAPTVSDYRELHRAGAVPPLGDGFSPALDPVFQRALAKPPERRWRTAQELAAALRVASGIDAAAGTSAGAAK